MSTFTPADRPRVVGIVILCLLGGVLGILGGLGLLAIIGVAGSSTSSLEIPGWYTLLAYLSLVLGVVELIAAILIALYKRIGLIVGGAIFLIGLINTVIQILAGAATFSIGTIIGILIDLAVLYYIYIYLTREPEKTFFS
jgi:hypothetical protein